MSPLRSVRIGLAAALASAACSDRVGDAASAGGSAASVGGSAASAAATRAPARPVGPITVRDPSGAVTAALTVETTTCTARLGDGGTVTVTRDADATRITGAPLTLTRAANGDVLRRNDIAVARVWRDPAAPDQVHVLDPDGIALVRVQLAGGGATLVDASRATLAKVVLEGGRFVAKDPRDAALAYVTGGDAELAALLTAPLPPDERAVVACDRLLPPAPVSP